MTGRAHSTPEERESAVRDILAEDDELTCQSHLLKQALGAAEEKTSLVSKPTATNLRLVADRAQELITQVETISKHAKHVLTLSHQDDVDEKAFCDRILANLALMRSSLQRLKEDAEDGLGGRHTGHALDDATRHYNDFVLGMIKTLGQAKALLHRYNEDVVCET